MKRYETPDNIEILPGQLNFIDFMEEFNLEVERKQKMKVEEFKELLLDCYDDMEIVVDTEGVDSNDAEIVGIDLDELENMAVIRIR